MQINHPFIKSVESREGAVNVQLADGFAIETFLLKQIPSNWEGVELGANLGVASAEGEVDWVRGAGLNMEEAVNDALQVFLNLVASPEAVELNEFVYRDENEIE